MAQKINMIGYKTGRLTVIAEAEPDNGARWICQCECGNTIIARGNKLRSSKPPKSCGCERAEKLAQYNKENRIKDISNQRFGNLVAICPTDQRNASRSVIWECKCDCGKIVYLPSSDLCRGHSKSCGCQRHMSFGESKIKDILHKNNIDFIQEWLCKDLVFSDSGYQARFDFYVNNSYIIEYDGIQHFIQGSGKYDNPQKFRITQNHDKIKNQYCFENNIPIIRIPYTELENITLEALQPETSPYLLRTAG